jgi:hypothetical protein
MMRPSAPAAAAESESAVTMSARPAA